MDSKSVNKEIRKHIWPVLKENGFSEFSTRSSWRYKGNRINVVNFQSFNSYSADISKCTTFSFIINLGIYLSYIPDYPEMKKKHDKLAPDEAACHLRRTLEKNLLQKEMPRKNIWYVDPSGLNLNEVIENGLKVILEKGFPWFDEFNDNEAVIKVLKQGIESEGGTFGFGNNPSPKRFLLLGFTASELGDAETAKNAFEYVIKSDCYEYLNHVMQSKINSL
ncbi:MAG: DUF4304 domain-containing protein [Alphaproteobacteria bacterium]|nr:DUF4304 domain-containing protein [Alphaproteobacteria bacterium]